ncbi:Gfo/Idh/MocA family oxidoreductase [Halomonas sp.]|uniref:Gfo/Idh/MocA family oxidoreductase n=1 Tax=Halomonas sp. TaxID=1486246 RepID=UPI003D11CD0C
MTIRLGVIGLSEGNGHPYSWSAIFNGYEPVEMENCAFPVIPRYLEQQTWPEARIPQAQVTAIWTQDVAISKHVARTASIATVCESLDSLAQHVDAILLARDDAENHLAHASRFIELGMPIYIDKPIALSLADLHSFYSLEQYPGQIFTCSALRYSRQLHLDEADHDALGEIREITAFTPKSWAKYAIHIIEPVLGLLKETDEPVSFYGSGVRPSNGNAASLAVSWKSGVFTSFHATGAGMGPLMIRVHGTKGWKDLVFTDSFSAFRAALLDFVEGIETRTVRSPRAYNEKVIKILEAGLS